MSGCLEVAFDMIESSALVTDTVKIVGVYEAPILAPETPSPLAVAIAQQIKQQGHFNEPCIVSVRSMIQLNGSDKDQSAFQKLEVQLHAMSSGGLYTLNKFPIQEPDFKTVQTLVGNKSYLLLSDFDDHFENVENDWMNTGLVV